ncbi:hypothetical protein K7432_007761 [Basidiobolus ranarum]|uniref:Inhibitor I9 domain-containing protein n=1 Tax=Basidiobolus ranarum TaxID=34480 RepID=A0ABR2WSW5_9FUNG
MSRRTGFSEYIVEIVDDAPPNYENHLEQIINEYDGFVKFRYGTVYRGFSAFMPRSLAERFSRDTYVYRVSLVKRMHTMTGFRPQRTHLEGPVSIRMCH